MIPFVFFVFMMNAIVKNRRMIDDDRVIVLIV